MQNHELPMKIVMWDFSSNSNIFAHFVSCQQWFLSKKFQNENWEFHMKIPTMRIFAKKWFHCGKKCTKILAFNEKSHVRIFNWGSSLCPCKALLWLLAGGPGHWSEEFHSLVLENSFCVATNVWWILMPSHCPVTSFCGVVPDLGGPVLSVVPVAPSQLAQWH